MTEGATLSSRRCPGAFRIGGFSLHTGVAAEAHESHKLEKVWRCITRPAISEQRLSISPQGRVRYALKAPWRNGPTHVEFEPMDFISKLAALVPPPRAHLTRFHGIFAPNANLRAQLTPAHRGKGCNAASEATHPNDRTPDEKRRAMTWAQRLKRVFGIDVETCVHCGGQVKIVASVEEPQAIRAILDHFEKHGALEQAHYRPAARAAGCGCVGPRRPRSLSKAQSKAEGENWKTPRSGQGLRGWARPADGNRREMARHCALRPARRRRDLTRGPPIQAQTGACAAAAYSPHWSSRD